MISSISNARDQKKNWVKNCKFSRKIGSHIWNVPNCQKVVVKTRTTTILKCQPAVLSRRMELFRFPTVAKNLRATAPLLSSFIFFRVRKGRAIDFFSQFFESVRRTQQRSRKAFYKIFKASTLIKYGSEFYFSSAVRGHGKTKVSRTSELLQFLGAF